MQNVPFHKFSKGINVAYTNLLKIVDLQPNNAFRFNAFLVESALSRSVCQNMSIWLEEVVTSFQIIAVE